jgi:hypothetical protein
MLQKFIGAVVLVLVGSIALAETLRGTITAVDGDKVSITVRKKGEKKGEKKEYTLAKDAKIFLAKGKDDKEKSDVSALKAAIEKSKGGKGVQGSVEVTDVEKGPITELTYRAMRKKKAAE